MTYAEKVPPSCPPASPPFTNPSPQYVGFWLAYTLPTVVFCLCPLVLWFGRNLYVRSPPTGSVLGSALRILRYNLRGCFSLNPVRTWRNLKREDFWERAKPSVVDGKMAGVREGGGGGGGEGEGERGGKGREKWMTYDDEWVDEVKRGFKACAVFCWFPLYCQSSFVFLVFSLSIRFNYTHDELNFDIRANI
jgi:proton-dependent oligopeptide transporter, POT family